MAEYKPHKIFHDSIHGPMEIHPLLVRIIDTPEFQRLRYINQLGGVYYAYPGATHHRFEHCLGTCYLAGLMIETLIKNQPSLVTDFGVTKEEILCIKIAGLCHDLGHGPFSHAFDGLFINKCMDINPAYRDIIIKDGKRWSHEEGSAMMLDRIWDRLQGEFAKYFSDPESRKVFIKELIDPPKPPSKDSSKPWPYRGIPADRAGRRKTFLYEIVSNARNKIDVDKFDYLARDSHHLGIPNNFNAERYMKMARVMKSNGAWQICVRDKMAGNVYELFSTRHKLHKKAYQHHKTQSCELMVVDALLKATPKHKVKGFNLVEVIRHPEAYLCLRDSVLHSILDSEDPELAEAAALLQRIECRDMYRTVGITLPIDAQKIHETKEVILSSFKTIYPEDTKMPIALRDVILNFGNKDRNPVDNVRFFRKENGNPFPLKPEQVSTMLPRVFQESRIRLFYKGQSDIEFIKVKSLFMEITRKLGISVVVDDTEDESSDSELEDTAYGTDLETSPVKVMNDK